MNDAKKQDDFFEGSDMEEIEPPIEMFSQEKMDRLAKLISASKKRSVKTLDIYKPLPFQDEFHRSLAKVCILAKGNRTGGSLAGFVEVARCALDCDPYNKYDGKFGKIVCVGFGENHIGNVIYPMLFQPGVFRIIKDLKTKEWRTYRDWPENEVVMGMYGDGDQKPTIAPPLIEPDRIVSVIWKKRGSEVFTQITLDTGIKILAGNSCGSAKHLQGFDARLIHFDEDFSDELWFTEMSARTTAPDGFIRWTAMPQAESNVMESVAQLAIEDAGRNDPEYQIIEASQTQNPYLPRKAVSTLQRLYNAIDPEEAERRVSGRMNVSSAKTYPTFRKLSHTSRFYDQFGEMRDDEDMKKTEAMWILHKNNYVPPRDWCCYASVDPGFQIAAALFAAKPPPEFGDQLFIYDEIYQHKSTSDEFAKVFKRKVNHREMQAFIMDKHGGLITAIGSGVRAKDYYSRSFKKYEIESIETGHGFYDGYDKIELREDMVRVLLKELINGSYNLLIDHEQCPNLVREMIYLKKTTVNVSGRKVVTDKTNRKVGSHAVDNLEYLVAHGCPYVQPSYMKEQKSPEQIIAENRHRKWKEEYLRKRISGKV